MTFESASTAAVHYAPATGAFNLTFLLILLPLLSATILLLGGKRTNSWGHLLGCVTPILAFVVGLIEFFALISRNNGENRQLDQHLFTWVPVGTFHVNANLLLDPLSITFVLLITGVGSLIHVYSVAYMSHDRDRRRFFGELNLFIAAMLLLVLADNYLLLYVGWEGVGLASYLLIGFWSFKPSAAVAAKKAFLVNRVGDIGLSIGIMLMFATFGSVSFEGVFSGADSGHAQTGTMTAIGLLLLLGACGKSAQVPLQSWLLDAMEGPTPVSALIHAATMVTAGVYLIARSNAIYDIAPHARTAVEVVGAVTLIFGAVIGCAHDDIKKVLAASTMSQIGYMMLAVGIGPPAYAFGILLLVCHGFFKADMFLGAGSVMHANNDEVNMRRFGGLRKPMPWTFWTFTFGYLAIIGMIPFAGFFSKDKIIESALDTGGWSGDLLGAVALGGACITAFYMTRLMLMTFFGNKRWPKDVHPHESPKTMLVPMSVLALGSLVSGFLLVYHDDLSNFLTPSLGPHGSAGDRAVDAASVQPARPRGRLRRRRHRLLAGWHEAGAGRAPDPRDGADQGRSSLAVWRRVQRVGLHAPRPVPHPCTRLLRQSRDRRCGQRARGRHRRDKRARPPRPDRVRAVLCPVDACWRARDRRHPRPRAGGVTSPCIPDSRG